MADTINTNIDQLVKSVELVSGISKAKNKPWKGILVTFKNGNSNYFFPYPNQMKKLEQELGGKTDTSEADQVDEIAKKAEDSVDEKKSFLND